MSDIIETGGITLINADTNNVELNKLCFSFNLFMFYNVKAVLSDILDNIGREKTTFDSVSAEIEYGPYEDGVDYVREVIKDKILEIQDIEEKFKGKLTYDER